MKSRLIYGALIVGFLIFLAISFTTGYGQGKIAAENFVAYAVSTLKVLPFAFILIGLFEVWVKRETVERHLGEESGPASFFWAIVLGGCTIGPMIVAIPMAQTLRKKGARLSVVFTYLGAASVCRIPMTILEASYLGVRFTVVRYAVSLPLILVSALLMGRFLDR